MVPWPLGTPCLPPLALHFQLCNRHITHPPAPVATARPTFSYRAPASPPALFCTHPAKKLSRPHTRYTPACPIRFLSPHPIHTAHPNTPLPPPPPAPHLRWLMYTTPVFRSIMYTNLRPNSRTARLSPRLMIWCTRTPAQASPPPPPGPAHSLPPPTPRHQRWTPPCPGAPCTARAAPCARAAAARAADAACVLTRTAGEGLPTAPPSLCLGKTRAPGGGRGDKPNSRDERG